jgi:hypothetical protein
MYAEMPQTFVILQKFVMAKTADVPQIHSMLTEFHVQGTKRNALKGKAIILT